ncbi:MAG: IS630 family transposase [Pseudomonadota bacterium]
MVNIERKTHTHAKIRDRMNVLYLRNLGYKSLECAQIVGCHINTVTNYVKMYIEGGLDLVRSLNYTYSKHQLQDRFDEVDQAIEQSNCSTISQVSSMLRQTFNYDRSNEAVRQLLHRLGHKRRKSATFPGKTKDFDEWKSKQNRFIESLETLISKAERNELDLLFSDAAHFVYGKFDSYLWSKKTKYVPSGHGRYRINVYGAYDVLSNQVFSMYNQGYIDADFMVEYLTWLRTKIYKNMDKPIYMIMDNARYQHCKLVKQTAQKLNIILEFLPGYSPNLNVIERLWKYLKKIIAGKYCQSQQTFFQTVVNLIKSLNKKEHQDKLWKLLNPQFQQFEKSQILGC